MIYPLWKSAAKAGGTAADLSTACLISTGGSCIEVVDALREAGAEVLGVVSIFTYGLKSGIQNFADAKTEYHSLSNLDALVEVAITEKYITPEQKQTVLDFRNNL